MINRKSILIIALIVLLGQSLLFGQKPYRMGTTTASFLEIGLGGAGIAMGDAYVASANDMSAIYWNPAGLALMERSEAIFMYQPWIVDINSMFAGFGLVLPNIGTLGFGVTGMSYGDIDVTTLEYQNGTGEKYTAYDYAFTMSYARSLVNWFSFGASVKYIATQIWHSKATAIALDLGVNVQTHFFSVTGRQEDGMRLGMSIANYGSRMRFDGYDLLFPVDIDPDAQGNYQNLQGKYKMNDWELPLIFRVGIAVNPFVISNQRFTLTADALHPNNMSESVNVGGQYQLNVPGVGDFFLRAGYKALFMEDSQYGATFGGGVKLWMAASRCLKLDYAYHSIGVFGSVHCTSFGVAF